MPQMRKNALKELELYWVLGKNNLRRLRNYQIAPDNAKPVLVSSAIPVLIGR